GGRRGVVHVQLGSLDANGLALGCDSNSGGSSKPHYQNQTRGPSSPWSPLPEARATVPTCLLGVMLPPVRLTCLPFVSPRLGKSG
ncbi:unnamed protein product, partial [Discosporangium mesarthrocarpum]